MREPKDPTGEKQHGEFFEEAAQRFTEMTRAQLFGIGTTQASLDERLLRLFTDASQIQKMI